MNTRDLLPLFSVLLLLSVTGACNQTPVSRSYVDAPDQELRRWPSTPPR